MEENNNKPLLLDKIDYIIWGTGKPVWGDPREGFTRMFSKHILWLCHKKPMSAAEIANELNVPTVYVEEELEILRNGKNGKYGFLRRLENGKYAVNFILFDKDTIEKAHALYLEQMPRIGDIVFDYIEAHKEEYLSFPYLNKKVDLNLIIWQQVKNMAHALSGNVDRILREKYFADRKRPDRQFSIYGYVDNGKCYGGGCDSTGAYNICGFSSIDLYNIYITRIKKHFENGRNIATDMPIQLAIRAIEGLPIASLSEDEKEYAAKAIECGYLYRDGDMLYTKILVSSIADKDRLFKTTFDLSYGYFEKEAEHIAKNLAELIKKSIPDYLHGEYGFANAIAALPIIDALVEVLIEKGVLTPPESGIGAEGCWMLVEK